MPSLDERFRAELPDVEVESELEALAGELAHPLVRCRRSGEDTPLLIAPLFLGAQHDGIETGEALERARRLEDVEDPGLLRRVATLAPRSTVEPATYLVWELEEGETLRARLRRTQPPLDLAARLIRRLSSTVATLHAKGLVLGSLVPANVLVGLDGRTFVLAPGVESPLLVDPTLQVAARYRAPELLPAGSGELTTRSDVWSLGILLFELIEGEPPFTNSDLAQLHHNITAGAPPELMTLPPQALPEPMRVVLERALAPDPRDRFADAHELGEHLDGVLAMLEPRRVARSRPVARPVVAVERPASRSDQARPPGGLARPAFLSPWERLQERRRRTAERDPGPSILVWLLPGLLMLGLLAILLWLAGTRLP